MAKVTLGTLLSDGVATAGGHISCILIVSHLAGCDLLVTVHLITEFCFAHRRTLSGKYGSEIKLSTADNFKVLPLKF